jgi:AcrR family transcriptional regulator
MRGAKDRDVREGAVAVGFRIIAERGLEHLSVREVARLLGVSHQAPYRHFPSRDHILAEIVARCFDEFAEFLLQRPREQDPWRDLRAMGERYMAYAIENPLKYRLMFNTPLPDAAAHPAMMHNARRAFALLKDRLASMPLRSAEPDGSHADLDAMFVWSTLHGLASILQSDVLASSEISEGQAAEVMQRCMMRLSLALQPPGGTVAA